MCQTQWRPRDMIPWASWQNTPDKSLNVFTDAGFYIFWTFCIASIAAISAPGHSEAGISDWLIHFFEVSTSLDWLRHRGLALLYH